jgi:hypothetical protein
MHHISFEFVNIIMYNLNSQLNPLKRMASDILNKALERIAEAAYREDLYHSLDFARTLLVTGTPNHSTNETRDAVIEAIAIKALDPGQNTEATFRERLLQDGDSCHVDEQAYFRQLDKIVGNTVKAVIEERVLGRQSTATLEVSPRTK